MSKRGQISSEVFVYSLTMVIVGIILVLGYKYFLSSKEIIDKGELLQLQAKLVSDTKLIGNDFGAFKKISYTLPRNLREVCILDLDKKEQILSSKIINFYPLVKDSINSGVNRNIFLIGGAEQNSINVPNIRLSHYPYFTCFRQKGGKIEIGIEGLGNGKSLILRDFITKAKINKAGSTILKSVDELITIEVPSGTDVSSEEIYIEMVEPVEKRANQGISDIYEFGPGGTEFNPAVELRIKYSPSAVGSCPSQLNFYQFNEEGGEEYTIPSKMIDCENYIAVFDLDKFI